MKAQDKSVIKHKKQVQYQWNAHKAQLRELRKKMILSAIKIVYKIAHNNAPYNKADTRISRGNFYN